jgi:uncharacterized LabA/DUF88 family protein
MSEKVAILVDGAFYLRRAHDLFGEKTAQERASELCEYCMRHLDEEKGDSLYRIFYYDCAPIDTVLFHPLTQKQVNMKKTAQFTWGMKFLDELASKRKLAIRLGELQERESSFRIRSKAVKQLCRGDRTFDQLTEEDFELDLVQKGVDMRIGLDIASLAYKKQASKIVLIAGDSDFVPAAKHARREGIDFVLDPMWHGIRPELSKHIDGLRSCTPRKPTPDIEKLCVKTAV